MSKVRTDRFLIVVALLLLTLAGGAFYFDGWMWGSRRARGERIGVITGRSGDVRMKFEDDLKWSRASIGQELNYDDAIYSGDGSEAKLTIGQSQMTVTQNSLIVLRRDQSQSFLKLNYGTLFGLVAKNDKIIIDTGDGKKLELEATKDTQIVVRRDQGRTQLDVTRGEAQVKVDGKKTVVGDSSRLVFGKTPPPKAAAVVRLRALKPKSADVVASAEPTRLAFEWAYDNGRRATDDEDYVVEFSTDPGFKSIHAKKVVHGALETTMSVSQSLSLLYRVRAPDGQLSQVERVRYVRIESPLILNPVADQKFETDPGFAAPVELTFKRPDSARIVYQLSHDEQFTEVTREAHADDVAREHLSPGAYFARARSDYGGLGQSAWSPTRAFRVDAKAQILPLAQRAAPTRVLIPNQAYPPALYTAADDRVRDFLAKHGFLNSYLPLEPAEYDAITLQTDDGRRYALNAPTWPREKLSPGKYGYRYQTTKAGFLPSAWSKDGRLEIGMEPPRLVGDVTFGPRNEETDQTPAEFAFTPLLFARSYDVEIATNQTFDDATELKVTEPRVATTLTDGPHYWRARARDARGRLISAYAKGVKLNAAPAKVVPQFLAKRDPQNVETLETKLDRGPQQPLERNGWYAWLGTGENFIKYDQTINGRGAASYHQIRPGSQYFEGGYTSLNGIGGVVSYKGTPGEVQIANTSLASTAYRWTTMTVEAMMRKLSKWTLKGEPITYGMRVGLQMHRTPFLFLDETDDLQLKMNDMTTATIGLLADWRQERWKYYSYFRYQLPLSTRSDGSSQFSISPTFAFDGSMGASYNLTDRWKLGAFLYGQWHQYNFTYATSSVTNKGFQSLFYSSADLRLGYEF